MDHVRLRESDAQSHSELPAPSTEEPTLDVPLSVSDIESEIDSTSGSAKPTSEITGVKVSEVVPSPKPITPDKIPIRKSSRSIKPRNILDL